MTDLSAFPKVIPDHDSEEFWEAAGHGHLRVQVCLGCERGVFPPTPSSCPYCGLSLQWKDQRLECWVYSWVGVDHAIHEWEYGVTPFSVVLARLVGIPDVKIACFYSGPASDLSLNSPGLIRISTDPGDSPRFLFELVEQ
jgi:uncharacterized OB-fold protein